MARLEESHNSPSGAQPEEPRSKWEDKPYPVDKQVFELADKLVNVMDFMGSEPALQQKARNAFRRHLCRARDELSTYFPSKQIRQTFEQAVVYAKALQFVKAVQSTHDNSPKYDENGFRMRTPEQLAALDVANKQTWMDRYHPDGTWPGWCIYNRDGVMIMHLGKKLNGKDVAAIVNAHNAALDKVTE